MVGVDVMPPVGRFPREIRRQQPGMQDEADCVVQDARSREGTVAAVVGDDPEACPDYALAEAVDVDGDVVRQVGMSHDLGVG